MNTPNAILIRPHLRHLPVMRGMIERRILINFRCELVALAQLLPPPFRPKLVNGWGMAGTCLIRLGGMHPAFLPARCGLTSENAAHRIAVEWDQDGATHEGVFIPRRDTNAMWNRLVGGKLFPGVHHAADFQVFETNDCFQVQMRGKDGATFVRVSARVTDKWQVGSVFNSLVEATEFFRCGALGWSPRTRDGGFDGLELHCAKWRMESLAVEQIESSFFDNAGRFPPGSVKFDSAFLMRGITHEWHARGRLAVVEKEIL